MKPSFVAGFGPIPRDVTASRTFWIDELGIAMKEEGPDYWTTGALDGVKTFAAWPLRQAAEATFGRPEWPADLPIPQAWLEIDVATADEVATSVAELRSKGHRILRDAHEEPWHQTTARLLSPEGILVGVTYTPWLHGKTET